MSSVCVHGSHGAGRANPYANPLGWKCWLNAYLRFDTALGSRMLGKKLIESIVVLEGMTAGFVRLTPAICAKVAKKSAPVTNACDVELGLVTSGPFTNKGTRIPSSYTLPLPRVLE